MLNFYDRVEYIPEGMKIAKSNNSFFDMCTKIPDTNLARRILKEINNAEYVSDISFLNFSSKYGALDKQYLSTGAKTLFNIIQYPEICFNIAECGFNAIELLSFIDEGNIYCTRYVNIEAILNNPDYCKQYRGRYFNDYYDYSLFQRKGINNEEYSANL